MEKFFIKIKKEEIEIDKKVFLSLLNISYVQEYSSCKKAVKDNEINLSDLKDLAEKADIRKRNSRQRHCGLNTIINASCLKIKEI